MIRVRHVELGDREAWLDLWAEWQAHMGGAVPPDVSARSFEMMCQENSALGCLIAFDAGRATGIAVFSVAPFAWTGGPVIYLQDLFVRAAARGSGAGRALVQHLYDHADRIGAAQVYWMVDEDDKSLQVFYDRLGMRTPYVRYMRKPWAW